LVDHAVNPGDLCLVLLELALNFIEGVFSEMIVLDL